MADHNTRHLLQIAEDGLHPDSESDDCESVGEVTKETESVGRYSQRIERSEHIGRHSKDIKNHFKRVCANIFTIRSFTCIIGFASLLALALLLASTIILYKRPYPWRKDLITMVSGVTSSAAITILASFSYSCIHLLPITCTNNILLTLADIIADVVLSIFLFQVGFGLLEDEKGRWSYEGRDWCANPHHGGCSRLVFALGVLNEIAGYIAIFVGFVHIGSLMTRLITLFYSRCCSKATPHSSVFPNAEKFKFSSAV